MRSNAPRDSAPPVCLRSLPWERSKPAFEVPLVFDPKVSCLRLCSIVVSRCLLSDERNGTIGRMCAGQVPRADQKFAGDFTTGEFERSFESPYPLVQLEISLFIEPIFEGSKFHLQCFDLLRVVDDRRDFGAVAHDSRIAQQTGHIFRSIGSDSWNAIAVKGLFKICLFI